MNINNKTMKPKKEKHSDLTKQKRVTLSLRCSILVFFITYLLLAGFISMDTFGQLPVVEMPQPAAFHRVDLEYSSSMPGVKIPNIDDYDINTRIEQTNRGISNSDLNPNRYDINNDFKDILQYDTPNEIYTGMENLYVKILKLGFREMPSGMYSEWIQSLQENKEKYQNHKILINLYTK
jgi:hypothetical protein